MADKISIDEKFSKFTEHWRPKIVAELNGQQCKLAKIKGEYPFHAHEKEDEMFFCWKGAFILDVKRSASLSDGDNAEATEVVSTYVGEGEAIVVMLPLTLFMTRRLASGPDPQLITWLLDNTPNPTRLAGRQGGPAPLGIQRLVHRTMKRPRRPSTLRSEIAALPSQSISQVNVRFLPSLNFQSTTRPSSQ